MSLRILTWNLSYAYGPGSDGFSKWKPLPQLHFQESLSAMAAFIKNVNADIVLLQEVDFGSKRSAYLNQLEILSRKSNLLYHSGCISWDRMYVPFPGLNPLNHFGRVLSGGGILSKTPIRKITEDLLPKPRENHAAYNHFYLNRYLQIAEVAGLNICNLHLEAFSQENRELHLIRLEDRLKDYELDIAGGDFNGAIHLSESTLINYEALPAPEATFPADEPKQTLDGFVVKRGRFRSTKLSVHNTGIFSDHFPVLIELD